MMRCGVFRPLSPRCSNAATVCLRGQVVFRRQEGDTLSRFAAHATCCILES